MANIESSSANPDSIAEAAKARAAIAAARRIVIKIGTNTIARQKGSSGIDTEYLHRIAAEIADLVRDGRQIILVTSGAVGMGAHELGLARKPKDIKIKQACAAIGQPLLMHEYGAAFNFFGLTAAQLLVTRDAWDRRTAYLNLRSTVEALIERRVVPVFNENDSVSTVEIAFGDNDQLSAYVASKIDAELLIILSDVDALYDADPRSNPEAKAIPYVRELVPEMMASAGGKGTEFSTGGMKTKLLAVNIAGDAGCRVVIAHGRAPGVITRILAGETVGTLFDATSSLRNRQRWIKNASPQGSIFIDEGALAAIRANASLLPRGVLGVDGHFDRGAIVLVNGVAKVLTSISSDELAEARGKRTTPVAGRSMNTGSGLVARPEDIVFLDS